MTFIPGLVTTPVSGDGSGGYGGAETEITDQTGAVDDAEQLGQQVGLLLGEIVLIAQTGEKRFGRVHRGGAAQEVGAEKDQSSHLFLLQAVICLQEKTLELHFHQRPVPEEQQFILSFTEFVYYSL